MAHITSRFYHGIKGYWRRRPYERLGGKRSEQKHRNRFWRIRITRKLKLKLRYSPKKLLIGLRNGYVNMMMRMANSPMVAGSGVYGEAKFGMQPREYVYDEKVLIEIYKALVMKQAQLAPIDGLPVAVSR